MLIGYNNLELNIFLFALIVLNYFTNINYLKNLVIFHDKTLQLIFLINISIDYLLILNTIQMFSKLKKKIHVSPIVCEGIKDFAF